MNSSYDYLEPERHTSDAGAFASDGELEKIANLDARGEHGRDGRDGQSFRIPARGYGVNGRRGGDATPAERGQDAADVLIQAEFVDGNQNSDRIQIRGEFQRRGTDDQSFNVKTRVGDDGYVFVQGRGGKGGNGGRGGDGQPGSKGRPGRDATRYSSGGNGGPGGHGGNAGNPTDGEHGGGGSDVQLLVPEDQQGLLMLFKGNLAGGDIGFAGSAGRGGKGGKGGPGGSSYHWTETRSYTDSQGKRRTRTVFRSNPGGYSGRNGSNGAPSFYRAKDGLAGQPGRLRIVVHGPSGEQYFDSPFNLELVTFDVVGEYTILEPDSLISVDQLVVRNCGGMPTPPNFRIRVFLETDNWILQDDQHLWIDRAIEPGDTYRFEDSGLRFRVADYIVDAPRRNPFRLKHLVDPHARMESGIRRPFRQFENGEWIDVRFPVEITAVTCLKSLAPGESTRVIWAITNVGTETFDHKYLHRAVTSHVRWIGGDLNSKAIIFFDQTDAEHDLVHQQLKHDVKTLAPGETRVIETRIGIREDAKLIPYQGFAIGIDLHQQRPGSSDHKEEYRCVDDRQSFIRVAEEYDREDGSRFLLVANHRTSVNDIEKWTQMADYFGSSLDVWDVSYYGFFDLVRDVEEDESLLEQWRGMTIIIPNNYYETPHGKTVAFRELAKSQFLRAAADYDINFYVVGDSRTGGESMMHAALIPVTDEHNANQLKTQKEFLDAVKRWNAFVARAGMVVGNKTKSAAEFADTELGAVHEFDIEKTTMLFQPDEKWLENHARRLQRKLQKTDPLRRWIVVHRYDTGDTDTTWGFFRKRKVGKLEVRRTLDSTKGSAVLYEVDAIDIARDEFITSEQNKRGMFLALKFEDKVDRFIRLVSERKFPRFSENYIDRPLTDEEIADIGKELVDSILVDIYNEQQVARESKMWTLRGARPLMPKLNYLAERSLNYGVTLRQIEENSAGMDLLFQLIASIRWMAKESMSVWDWAIFPTAFFKQSRAVSNHMLNRADRIVTNIFGNEPSWWDKMSDPGDDFDAFGNARKKKVDGAERAVADKSIDLLEQSLRKKYPRMKGYKTTQDLPGLTYDPELMQVAEARVIKGELYDRMVQQERRADVRRQRTEEAIQAEREELLVPLEKANVVKNRTRTVTVTPSS